MGTKTATVRSIPLTCIFVSFFPFFARNYALTAKSVEQLLFTKDSQINELNRDISNLRQSMEELQNVEGMKKELNVLLDNKKEEIVALSKKNAELHSSLKNYEATANDTDKLQKIISQKNAEIACVPCFPWWSHRQTLLPSILEGK